MNFNIFNYGPGSPSQVKPDFEVISRETGEDGSETLHAGSNLKARNKAAISICNQQVQRKNSLKRSHGDPAGARRGERSSS